MKRRIGIFGGSFNPPHLGHESILESFLHSGLIDEIWVVPTPDPPHKSSADLVAYHHRYRMAELQFSGKKNCFISDFERNLPQPHITWNTLQALEAHHRSATFFLCIGGDSWAAFQKWVNYRAILEHYPILIAERPENATPDLTGTIHWVSHEPVAISATNIREDIKQGKSRWKDMVQPDVAEYITAQALYLD